MDDRVRYARNGDITIAYKVIGDGPRDLVYVLGSSTNIGTLWENDRFRRSCERLASFSRLIVFDKRGMGLSDRVEAGTMEDRMDDVRAVMDAVGSQRAVILGLSEGGLMATLFAASHPDRTEALVLIGSETREENDAEWAWGDGSREEFELSMDDWSTWGDGRSIDFLAPSLAGDPEERAWWGRHQLQAGNPRTIEAHSRVAFGTDTRAILPTVRVPTLVVHRTDDRGVDVHQGRYLGEHIPGARYVELPGADHVLWVNGDDIIEEVEEFLTGARSSAEPDRVLATVLFSDIVGSTVLAAKVGDHRWAEILGAHHGAIRRELARYRGDEIDTAGDGFLASFDGPARAIRCAVAIRAATARLDLPVRIGLHTGECERIGSKLGGIAVHTGARVAGLASAGEVLVSGTVRDLVAGSGIGFEDRGVQELAGVPGDWRIFAVV